MSLRKIKSEIIKLKEIVLESSTKCYCQYVEIEAEKPPSLEEQIIIESNMKCRKSQNPHHVGYSMIIINPVKRLDDES